MRVTDAKLRSLVLARPTDDLTIFIELAELLVNENLTSTGQSDDRLDLIAAMLAAHFLVLSQGGQKVKKWVGESREEIAFQVAKDFGATHWGTMAQTIDTSGILAGMCREPRAQFRVVGRLPRSANPVSNEDGDTERT